MSAKKRNSPNGVSFSGRMGSGKNYCGDLLQKYVTSKSLGGDAVKAIQLSFGNGVKRFGMFLLGQPCFTNEEKETEIPEGFEYNIDMAVYRMFVSDDFTKTPTNDGWMKKWFCINKSNVCTYRQMIDIIAEGLKTHAPTTRGRLLQVLGTEIVREKIHQYVWVEILRREIARCNKEKQRWIVTDARFPNEICMIESLGGVCVYVDTIVPYNGTRDKNHPSETALDGRMMHIIHNDRTTDSDTFIEFLLNGKWDEVCNRLKRLPIEVVGNSSRDLVGPD
ncbi:MAG: hypothetical protein AB7P49_00135 [Bdellovibrionales bacterium]